MWYEPGDAFFSAYYGLHHETLPQNDLYFRNMTRRVLNYKEQDALMHFYNYIFSCNYKDLPPEAMAHYFLGESSAMDEYVSCMSHRRTKYIDINSCKNFIHSTCSSDLVETSLAAKCPLIIETVQIIIEGYPNISDEKRLLMLLNHQLAEHMIYLSFNKSEDLLQFIRHGLCIEKMRKDNIQCIDKAEQRCRKDNLIVVQVNRMNMEDLGPIIKANPDIYVVHYTRDPRAIALSRYKTGILLFDKVNRSTVREAQFICDKMREDIRQRLILEKKYPGIFVHLTYESLAEDPEGFAKTFYGLFNESYPTSWNTFIEEYMHEYMDGSTFGITVRNATETALRFRTEMSKHDLDTINKFCSDVIISLGYMI
ncbi:hypothetical protein LSH36_133g05056 [Paralvinella palmiformis]|uniref:Sulfotransferase n=1 Tax=Paralvinella palmiformis TaxID=53620 RepID=A0AAD9JVZ3_9ANNE|nr:hypothetical protein LSH36_133g05056 [Paralvinella palmiformis]